MTWVKVCGLTRHEDVAVAIAAGADAVGFVTVPESPRAIPFERVAELAAGVSVLTILLAKDLLPQDLVAAALATGVDGVQLYGENVAEAASAAIEVGLFVLRPVTIETDLANIPASQHPLYDHRIGHTLGGTGQTFDHSQLPVTDREFVLAGGLGADNVADIVRKVRPWGVDASSKLEQEPGRKDSALVERFVRAAKEA